MTLLGILITITITVDVIARLTHATDYMCIFLIFGNLKQRFIIKIDPLNLFLVFYG